MIEVLGAILERRDTTTAWNYTNPILPDGQLGWEFADDGVTPVGVKMGKSGIAWDDLKYWFSFVPTQVTTEIISGVTENPITVPYGMMVNPTLIFRNSDGSNYSGAVNNVDTGSAIVLTGDDDGSGHFADSFSFIIKP